MTPERRSPARTSPTGISWWPEDDLPADGYTCGDWMVVEVGGDFFTWN